MSNIEDFGVTINSPTEIEIYHSLGGKEISTICEIDVDYQPFEPMEATYPGCLEEYTFNEVFGLSIQECDAFDKWMCDNDIELMLLEHDAAD